MEPKSRSRILVVGSGPNGISVAVRLQEAGYEDFRIITRHEEFGGSWYQCAYPGCAVSFEFTNYQFTYAPSTDWRHLVPTQPELFEYMKNVAVDRGLYPRTDFGVEMTAAAWNESKNLWTVETTAGTYEAAVLVLATGFLDELKFPQIEGLANFEGRVLHAGNWPADYDGSGDRVAVVGSSASAVQLVPALQKVAKSVTVLQRNPLWLLPLDQRELSGSDLETYRNSPELMEKRRAEISIEEERVMDVYVKGDREWLEANAAEARQFLDEQVPDPELRRLVTPKYEFGCRDWGFSNEYFPSLLEDNVELVPEAATKVGPSTIEVTSGRVFEVDTIALATGFRWGTHILERIRRRDGRTVAESQAGHTRAYKTISVSGCPNLFLVGGPAPNGRVTNGLAPGEISGRYVANMLSHMDEHGFQALEVKEDAETAWKERADSVLDKGLAVNSPCATDAIDESGHDQGSYPGTQARMEAELATIDADAYESIP